MTSESDFVASGAWVCVEQTPERSHAARVEALLRQAGLEVRVVSGETTAAELEVQVHVEQLHRAVAELEELDRLDDGEED